MARVAHLSDLHFGEAPAALVASLGADIRAQAVDFLAVSGDLTRRAETGEFTAALNFLTGLELPMLVVPGNHDIPRYDLRARFLHPRRRWDRAGANAFGAPLQGHGLRLVGLDTVSRAQWHLDWAAGSVPAERRSALAPRLDGTGMILLVCHHPLRHKPWAATRHAPRHAAETMALLKTYGVAGVLCGHLHQPELLRLGPDGPLQIIAPSAFSPRVPRALGGTPNGWNLIEASAGQIAVTTREWLGDAWVGRRLGEG